MSDSSSSARCGSRVDHGRLSTLRPCSPTTLRERWSSTWSGAGWSDSRTSPTGWSPGKATGAPPPPSSCRGGGWLLVLARGRSGPARRDVAITAGALVQPVLDRCQRSTLTTPDLWFDDVGMAVMVHSRAFHAGSLQWDETVVGDSDLSTHRIVVVGVTPEQLTRDPRSVLRRIEAHHEAARCSRFRPDVIATRRSGWNQSA